MISRGIYALLSGATEITSQATGGIYPLLLPKGLTAPAITYQVVGGNSMPTLNGSGLQKLRVQFDCWAASYDPAAAIRAALIGFLNGYQGQLTDGTYLQNADLIQSIDFYDQDAQQPRCSCEFYLYFNFTS